MQLSGMLEDTSVHYCVSVLPQTRELLYYPITVGHFECRPSYRVQRNSFYSYLLILMRRGSLRYRDRQGRGVAQAGQALLLDCNAPHSYEAAGSCAFSFLHFDGAQSKALYDAIARQKGTLLQPAQADQMLAWLDEIIRSVKDSLRVDEVMTSAQIYRMLMLLLRANGCMGGGTTGVSMLDTIADYVQAHLCEKLTVERLAAQAGYSAGYLSRLFSQESGMSLYRFVVKCRVERAEYLLRTTRCSIEEVAFQAGFSSAAHFSHAFRQETGLSPTAYRSRSD